MMLDLKDVATRLGVHYATARDFVLSGALQGIRLAGRRKIQVEEADLLAFIEASKIGPKPGPIPIRKRRKMAHNHKGQKLPKARPHAWREGFRGA